MTHPVAPNTLNREFTAKAPNKKWITDTAVYSNSPGVALCSSYSGSVFTNDCRMEGAQAIVTGSEFNMHSIQRLLVVAPKQGCCITVIEGGEYTSRAYQACLENSGIQVSMSRKGNCWDNAAMESWIAHMKR